MKKFIMDHNKSLIICILLIVIVCVFHNQINNSINSVKENRIKRNIHYTEEIKDHVIYTDSTITFKQFLDGVTYSKKDFDKLQKIFDKADLLNDECEKNSKIDVKILIGTIGKSTLYYNYDYKFKHSSIIIWYKEKWGSSNLVILGHYCKFGYLLTYMRDDWNKQNEESKKFKKKLEKIVNN